MRVGIPRSLLYYQYLALWKTFFQEMGCEVVLSAHTNKAILSGGISRVVAETCLPVKAYCGHVMDLRGKCDYVFVPALKRIQKDMTTCSKFQGLPDIVKAVVPQCPPLLEIDIDINKGNRDLYQQIYMLGKHFTWNPLKIKSAFEKAWQSHTDYTNLMYRHHLNPAQTLPGIERGGRQDKANCKLQTVDSNTLTCTSPVKGEESFAKQQSAVGSQQTEVRSQDSRLPTPDSRLTRESISLGLVGHPYMLYDDFINHRLRERLEKMGAALHTPEMVSQADKEVAVGKVVGKSYWGYEDELIGAGGYYLDGAVDGVIAVVSFGCGPDSLMVDLISRYAREKAKKPFLSITMDEHTGEAGILTRLEAFVDMLKRRKGANFHQAQNAGLAI